MMLPEGAIGSRRGSGNRSLSGASGGRMSSATAGISRHRPRISLRSSGLRVRFREQSRMPLSIARGLYVSSASNDPHARMLFGNDASQDGSHRQRPTRLYPNVACSVEERTCIVHKLVADRTHSNVRPFEDFERLRPNPTRA